MEDGNTASSITSTNNEDIGEAAGMPNVNVNSPVCDQTSNSNNEDEVVKSESSESMMDCESLEQLKVHLKDESYANKPEDQESRGETEESGPLSVKPTELNGELEVSESATAEELQNEGELQPSLRANDGEYSGCDIVRRSIRNRKSTDSKISAVVKQPKPLKDSATKKNKKPLPIVGTNNEPSKKMTAQVESSKVAGFGGVRPRKKAQRKRERKSGCTLRIVGSSRGETAPRQLAVTAPLTCTEYAQCLGLQPAVKFKCHKCGETNFASVGMLREHQVACPGMVGGVTSEEAAACATMATSGSNLHITQKLILCSACDTYFESWDLFLHMQSVHRRHICLFCLAMFSRAERLALHLGSSHGAIEASHPSADAFRSSRQSPCLLVCCTCERIFSDGDEFFDHSCRSGGFAAATGESNGSMSGGGNGEGQGEFTGGGKCSDNSQSKECSSGTSALDCSRNLNSNQGATDVDGDCTINDAANLCQLHIRVAAKKALKRKDNVLVVIFEKGEPNSDQIMMRVESKDSWETTPQDSGVDVDEVEPLVVKNSSEESISEEFNAKKPLDDADSVDKDGGEDLPETSLDLDRKELDDCTIESNVQVSDDDSKQKRSETDESSADELDKTEMDDKRTPSPEIVDKITPNVCDHLEDIEMPSDEEEEERDINMDLTISDATEDSQIEAKIRSPSLTECDDKHDVSQHSFKETMKDMVTNVEEKAHSGVDNSNFNGNDYSSESPKSLMNESNEEGAVLQEEKSEDTNSQADDDDKDVESDRPTDVDVKENEPDVTQQNGIEMSPEAVQGSTIDSSDDSGGVQVAGEEVSITLIPLEKNLECYRIQDLLKEAVKVACFSCVYCTHAKKIAVNGKQLAFHLLAEHRFQPDITIKKEGYENERHSVSSVDHSNAARLSSNLEISDGNNLVKSDVVSETHVDRLAVGKFVEILKNSLTILEKSCFNCDSYDNTDTLSSEVFSKTYECFQCRFATGLHKELYIHNRKMHQKTNLLCIMCKCNFYSYSELLCHLCPGVYVPNERPNFRCCFCSADNLPSAFRFMVHLRKRHHACDVCLEVTGDQQRLSGHVWKHKLNHLCYRCDIAYRNKPDITKHLFWKHGTESVLCKRCLQKKWPHVYHFCVPPAIFTCEECSSTFSRAVALRVHRRLHLGEAPHACPECGQHFISKRLVVRHQELKHGDPNSKEVEDNLSDAENVAIDSKASPKEGYQSGHNDSSDQSNRDSLCAPHLQDSKIDGDISADEDNRDGFNLNRKASPCKQVKANDISNGKDKIMSDDSNKVNCADVVKDQKVVKKVVDVMDLPPLNLSSESDDSDDEVSYAQQNVDNCNAPSSEICDDGEKQDPGTNSPVPEEEVKPVEFVDGIWDNFKTYTATLEDPKSNLGETSSDSVKGPCKSEDLGLMARIIKAEHDYCFSRDSNEEVKEQVGEQEELKVAETVDPVVNEEQDDGFDHNYCSNTSEGRKSEEIDVNPSEMQEASPKKHPKSPKKRKKAGSGSSSSEARSDRYLKLFS